MSSAESACGRPSSGGECARTQSLDKATVFPALGVPGGAWARMGPIKTRAEREEGRMGEAGAGPYLHAGRAEPCGP